VKTLKGIILIEDFDVIPQKLLAPLQPHVLGE
jgi:hypothetical protein